MGFSPEKVAGFVAMIGVLSVVSQVIIVAILFIVMVSLSL